MPTMKMINVIEHPILKHNLSLLRDKKTAPSEFRGIMREMARMLAYEATRNHPTTVHNVESPMGVAKAESMDDHPVIVSILRAGNIMLDGLLSMLPLAAAGHIGIYRDKFIRNTVEYYFRLPEDVKGKTILLTDPLLATGDTVIASVDRLKQYNVSEIKFLSILVSREGVERLHHFHPDVEIFTVGIEEELDSRGYLVPGIGDVGARLYATR